MFCYQSDRLYNLKGEGTQRKEGDAKRRGGGKERGRQGTG